MSDDEFMPDPCPECSAGKCANCDGTTWNNHTDTPDVCPCYMAGHGEEHANREVLRTVAPHHGARPRVAYRLYSKAGRAS